MQKVTPLKTDMYDSLSILRGDAYAVILIKSFMFIKP